MDITPRQFEIIEAAGRILTTSGVSGLTIKNIAKEMRFSESAVYRHFTSKEEIIIALLDYLSDTLDERLLNTVQSENNPEAKFKAIFRNLIDFFTKNPEFVVAVFSDGLIEESQQINQTILKLMNVLTKHLVPVIREGQQLGLLTNAITTEELVYIAIGTFKLQMFKWKMAGFQFDIVNEGNKMVSAVLILIKNK
jgi:TetR/AcrR family transcriptional regulator, fatty acid metabolism regulator protein